MARSFSRLGTIVVGIALCCMGCDVGPKTEQAIGGGMVATGAAVTPIQPEVGIPLMVGGVVVTVHGVNREEAVGGR